MNGRDMSSGCVCVCCMCVLFRTVSVRFAVETIEESEQKWEIETNKPISSHFPFERK